MNLLKTQSFLKLRSGETKTKEEISNLTPEEFKKWRDSQKIPVSSNWNKNKSILKTYDELSNERNVGMVIPQGYIVVDIDNNVFADRIEHFLDSHNMKCIKTQTGKGKHFMFRDDPKHPIKQVAGWPLVCGVLGDTRVADKGQIAIKFMPDASLLNNNDGLRIYKNIDLDDLDVIPSFLYPLTERYASGRQKEIIDLEWERGTRDESFRDWTAQILWKKNISNKKLLINIIWNIDRFILSDKFPHFKTKNEVTNRVEGWTKWADNTIPTVEVDEGIFGQEDVSLSTFNLNATKHDINYMGIIKHIIKLYNIRFYNDIFWMKEGTNKWHYPVKIEEIWDFFIRDYGNVTSKLNEKVFYKFLRSFSKCNKTDDNKLIINFKNYRYNILEQEVVEYKKEDFLTFGIEYNYNPNAKWERVDKTFDTWTGGNKEVNDALFRFIGLTFYSSNEFSKALFLLGTKAQNGKSTYMKLVRKIIGDKYTIANTLGLLESTHGLDRLPGSKVILIEEVQSKNLDANEIFKSIVTGMNPIVVNRKFQGTFDIVPTQKIMGGMNEFPRSKDKTDGFLRRLVILPFNSKFSQEEVNTFKKAEHLIFGEKGIEYIINRAMTELIEMFSTSNFKEPQVAIEIKEKIRLNNIPVLQWLQEKKSFIGITLAKCYTDYRQWCFDNGYKPVNKSNFTQEIEMASRGDWCFKRKFGDSTKCLYQNVEEKNEKPRMSIKDIFGDKLIVEKGQ